MKTSKNGLDFIAKWEGVVLKPYKDVAGLRTIGIGHLITPSENFPDGVEITREQAMQLLSADVAKCESAIAKVIKVPLTQNQFDALISFGFNCGVGVYSTSSACKALNTGDNAGFISGLMMWDKARVNGVMTPVAGLTARRRAEGELFKSDEIKMEASMPWTKELLVEVQSKLQSLKLYTKKVDGVWGPGTDAALKAYAVQMSLKLTCSTSTGISSEMLKKLRENF